MKRFLACLMGLVLVGGVAAIEPRVELDIEPAGPKPGPGMCKGITGSGDDNYTDRTLEDGTVVRTYRVKEEWIPCQPVSNREAKRPSSITRGVGGTIIQYDSATDTTTTWHPMGNGEYYGQTE